MKIMKLENQLIDREKFLIDYCKGKYLLHLGCCGAPHCEENFNSGELLHTRLLEVAKECHGIDFDEESVNFLRRKGINNLFITNIEALDEKKYEMKYDIIIAGEILEHLNNFGLFLAGIKKLMNPYSRLILTVPNAITLKSFLRALLGREKVNPDHICYFSYKTLKNLLSRYGFIVEQLFYYCSSPIEENGRMMVFLNKFAKYFCYAVPKLGDGLVVVSKLGN